MKKLAVILFPGLFVILGSAAPLFAQTQTVDGVVTSRNGYVGGAAVRNIRLHINIISDIHGNFSIRANIGDTLVISKNDFKTDTVETRKGESLVIELKTEPLKLKEVHITGSPLSPEAKFRQKQQAYHNIYRIGDDKNMVIITPIGIGLDIDKLYSALSRQGKNARRLQHEFTSQYREDVIDQKFNRSLVARITGYKNAQLDDFMARHRPTYAFVRQKNEYEVIQYIKACMKK